MIFRARHEPLTSAISASTRTQRDDAVKLLSSGSAPYHHSSLTRLTITHLDGRGFALPTSDAIVADGCIVSQVLFDLQKNECQL